MPRPLSPTSWKKNLPQRLDKKDHERYYRALDYYKAGRSKQEIAAATGFSAQQINAWWAKWDRRVKKAAEVVNNSVLETNKNQFVELINDVLTITKQQVGYLKKFSEEGVMLGVKEVDTLVKTAERLEVMSGIANTKNKKNPLKTATIRGVQDIRKMLKDIDPLVDYDATGEEEPITVVPEE